MLDKLDSNELKLEMLDKLDSDELKLEVVDEFAKELIVLESMGFKPLIVTVKLTSTELKTYKEVSNDKSETF